MPLNTPSSGYGFMAVTTTPGATVYFYATANYGMQDVMPSAGSWAVLNGTLAPDGAGVVADSDGIAAIQAPWLNPGNLTIAVAFGGGAQCAVGACLAGNGSPGMTNPGTQMPLNKRGSLGPLSRIGRLSAQFVRMR